MARNQKRKAHRRSGNVYFSLDKDHCDKKPRLCWSYSTTSDPILYCKSDGTVDIAPDSSIIPEVPSIYYCTQDGSIHSSPDSSLYDDSVEIAVEKPDLEAYASQDRSWWDVEILDSTSQNKYIKVHYAGFPEEDDEWLPVAHLRVRSRPCEYSYTYCDELFPGIDVSVATRHPDSDEPSQVMWFDARIIDIQRKPHSANACSCSFWIALYEIPEFLHRKRKLLPVSPWAVALKDMTTMRVARNVYFEDLIAASLPNDTIKKSHIWITEGECWNSSLRSVKPDENLHDFAEYLEKTLMPAEESGEKVVKPLKEVTYADLFLKSMPEGDERVSEEEDEESGLLPSWNPFEVQLEAPVRVEDDPFADVWEDMCDALKSVEKNLENDDLESCTIDKPSKSCVEHTVTFDQEVGEVCGVCGFILLSIQDIWVHDNVKRIACESDGDNGSCDHEFASAWDEELFQSRTVEEAASEVMFELIPNLAKQMQRHQRQGFLFLWRNLAGQDCSGNSCSPLLKPGGCVLSHAPGTGKTFLIISFLQSYMKKYPECRPVVIAPKIMLLPWEAEFRKWNVDIPIYNFDGDAVREQGKTIFQKHLAAGVVHFDVSLNKNMLSVYREAMLLEWLNSPGVLVISYQTFNLLTLEDASMVRMRSILLERPSMVILDEGHYARNNLSQVNEQVMAIKTPLRVMLSGTLFQNNFEELYTCLNLVRPGFVKTSGLKFNVQQSDIEAGEAQAEKKLFIEEIGNKIDRGQVAKCSPESLAEGLRLLRRLTAPFVHHYTGGVLREQLPPLREFVIVLQPGVLQQKMIVKVAERMLEKGNLEREGLLSLVCIHPFLLSKHSVGKAMTDLLSPEEMMQAGVEDPAIGAKTQFVMNLLERLCHGHEKEKTLIFCVTLDPLMLLEKMMEVQFGWIRDKEMLHINGKVAADVRQSIIERFNDPRGKARVLLLSTKACGEGVTLTGASRVVFMDVLWNPSVRRQAIHRAFRIGQTKVVHVYNLVVEGSLEEVKYRTMVWKDWKSQTLFHGSDEAHDESVANLGRRSNGFWRLRKQASKDSVLNDLERHDAALAQPTFKHVFRHGGLFDDEYAGDPESRGVDARDWLRGISHADDPQRLQSVETDLGGVSSL